jgi:hypothetical protein
MLIGVVSALATAFIHLRLRVPGHAILRAVFPMALGMALVPRRAAGSIMGASAATTALGIYLAGLTQIGTGAATSLCLTGPMLDLVLARARSGWKLYLGFILAGLASNLVAFAVHFGEKLLGLEHSGGRPLALWWPQAIVSYAMCGAIAGLVSALVWFQARSPRPSDVENSR